MGWWTIEKRLSELKPGERGIVTRVSGSGLIKKRLLEMGLVKGTEIVMVRKAPLGDPIEFQVKGYNLSLRKVEADNVFVTIGELENGYRNSSIVPSRKP
ncbi:Ferrous iron transport protein A [Thermofilum adornatum 1505]|uniref:Ferrous iron transport protein A n=1 Tax=Thermofilum adornatum 1505 TaxID=697581 RepID=A0A3G1A7V2_9CREN|nr:FeoA family protein [Thermofilum adornatum]AJB41394.1 Ferrous iron transport protein A [Thermofilum adornatum 1505]